MSDVKIRSNNNFHQATKTSVFDGRQDWQFREYRRRWKEYPENFIVGDYPLHLDIENTTLCNLKCPMCARTFDKWGRVSKEIGFMDMNLYRQIIDEGAKNCLCSIKLSLRGEPLLHPNIVEMVAYAKKKGIMDIYFNTNAMLLDEKMCRGLIEAGLPRISISIEGIESKMYEKYRPGAKFDVLVKNVKTLNELRKQYKVSYPQIRIQAVLTDEMKLIFDKYVEFWQPFADEVSYLDCREEGEGVNHRGKICSWACPFLWQRMAILWDGTLLPCLAHGVKDYSNLALGKIPEVSVKQMWQSDKVNRMRALHKRGRAHQIPECDECSYRALEIKKLESK